MILNKIEKLENIRGILFDVDGTLYDQNTLRVIMLFYFILFHFYTPVILLRKIQIILAYRKAQEKLRYSGKNLKNYHKRQLELAVLNTGESYNFVSSLIREWFETRPLYFLKCCRRPDLSNILDKLHNEGFILGVYSDYPVHAKIKALRIEKYFSFALSANDPEVVGLKPSTNGFVIAATRMKLEPSEILYVGDRPDVDGGGATAAGMPVVIIKGWLKTKKKQSYPIIRSLKELLKLKLASEKLPNKTIE